MIRELDIDDWHPQVDDAAREDIAGALEAGGVLYFPRLAFAFARDETRFFSPKWSDGKSKNIYLRGAERTLRGARGEPADKAALRALIERFAGAARSLVTALLPRYAAHLRAGNTSYRPCRADGRATSWRKDDTRMHTDAFPSNPTGGVRILRVFSNVNPAGEPRVWRIGEPFEALVARYRSVLRPLQPGYASLLETVGVTKSRRSRYDHAMLQLHDLAKADAGFQRESPQERMLFPPGATWVCFSDQVLHAAMSGQYMMEQTFLLPVAGMYDPEKSPLRVLEREAGRTLT